MPKNKFKRQESSAIVEKTKDQQTDDGWTIQYCEKSNRYDLRKSSILIYSDTNESVVKRVAEKHGVKEKEWKKF